MNVLFLSLMGYSSIKNRDIYTDLLREFINQGHKVYIVSPAERRQGIETGLIEEENSTILRVKTGNIQKTNLIEKGISTVMLEPQFVAAIKSFFGDIKFDLILYSTPPITIAKAVEYVKKRDNATTYLMLKDIFPQNAVDLGMLSTTGLKGFLYRFFRMKEKQLYAVSDRIGCMSPANCEYVLKHNPEIDPKKVEVNPNSIEVVDMRLNGEQKTEMRKKYGIPLDKIVFVYGGNLGKPQGIPFLIECLKTQENNDKAFFLIVGDGTEYGKLEAFVNAEKPANTRLLKRLPKEDYDRLVAACDVGMIFLDHRFTIPNFPSRLLSYMQAGLPVLACTDPNTDIGKVITDGGFGWWCESKNSNAFSNLAKQIINQNEDSIKKMQDNATKYLCTNYSVRNDYEIIIDKCGVRD